PSTSAARPQARPKSRFAARSRSGRRHDYRLAVIGAQRNETHVVYLRTCAVAGARRTLPPASQRVANMLVDPALAGPEQGRSLAHRLGVSPRSLALPTMSESAP